ncbi:MAG: nuclear transport factor 2 family protein [Myxococcota bacterium]|nr:nuclear transport factor 2 family protein [Myxococcales bacterium]
MADEHPARRAGFLSQKYVANGQREEWLALFADEGAVVQDPVGVSPLDPTGKGQIGKQGIAAFWDNVISKGRVSFDYPKSYAAGDECAFIGKVINEFPNGQRFEAEGVFVYRVNEEGKLLSLRAFWEFARPTTDGVAPHPPVSRAG